MGLTSLHCTTGTLHSVLVAERQFVGLESPSTQFIATTHHPTNPDSHIPNPGATGHQGHSLCTRVFTYLNASFQLARPRAIPSSKGPTSAR